MDSGGTKVLAANEAKIVSACSVDGCQIHHQRWPAPPRRNPQGADEKPELGAETISVVFFLDIGLQRSQQMFADLNRYAIRPSRSLGLLYDHRNEKAKLARLAIMKSDVFRDLVDLEKSSLAPRSRKLFTLSAFYNACADLIEDRLTATRKGLT